MNWDLSTYEALEYMSLEALDNNLIYDDDEEGIAKVSFCPFY